MQLIPEDIRAELLLDGAIVARGIAHDPLPVVKLFTPDGQQLRRINRDLKKYARSRFSWRTSILSGFGITVLATERFGQVDREDQALYETMIAIRDRLNWNLQIAHPVTPGDYVTSGPDDACARCFRDKLSEAIDMLQPLFEPGCTRERALKC